MTKIREFRCFLKSISEMECNTFDRYFDFHLREIADLLPKDPEGSAKILHDFFEICYAAQDLGLMQYHSRFKPLGYPGDHLVIDWIYQRKVDARTREGELWDRFYHRQPASQAVRNRKAFFNNLFRSICDNYPYGFRMLNLASGPCRDLAEALCHVPVDAKTVKIHCVDADYRAVDYGKAVLGDNAKNAAVVWEVKNVFKLRPHQSYELVWSAGLFDYLNDRVAAILLKKMWKWTADGGMIVIGNFHPSNPSRDYMEICGDWYLIHRTEEEMLALCERAGIPLDLVSFKKETLGINIFCTIEK